MRSHARGAFTLAELMVVISIIALLAAMLVPTFSQVFHQARRVLCANKLEKIGQAYHGYNAKAQIDANADRVTASSWTGQVLNWMGDSGEILICPESDPKTVAGGPITMDELQTLVLLSHGHNRWTNVMEDTEYTLGCGLPEDWPVGIQNRSMHWEVLAKSSSSFKIALEDSWQDNPPDRPYKDLVLQFDFVKEGVRVTYLSEGTGSFHYALKYANGDVILEGMGEGVNGKNFGMSALIQSLYKTSYGMSSVADRIHGPKNVVLVLDYEKAVADCAGDEPGDLMDWQTLVAPRHRGKVNVLLESGAVKTFYPTQIDPTTPEGLKRWQP
jgi:prepilin-type N-terminal cleavage/methylation domain-containing protein